MNFSNINDSLTDVYLQYPTIGVIIAALLAAILLLVSGFASGSEIAFFSLSPVDIAELDGEKREKDKYIEELRND